MQIIKNSQTKCMNDEWYRSNLMFDTISFKQISPLTQSVVFWDSWMSVSQDKMIYSTEKKHTRSMLHELIYVFFSLFDSNANKQNILSVRFFQKLFFMNEGLWIYTLLNKHTISEIIVVYRLTYWLLKKKKLLFRQEGPIHTCLKPNPMSNLWVYKLIFSIIAYIGLKDSHYFNIIFKWAY